MILAAGRGERLRPLTDRMPKALVSVGGVPLIDRHLAAIRQVGVTEVVINLGWLGEQIVEYVGAGERHDLQVVYSPEGDELLETGGGIRRALPMLAAGPDDVFLVSNADVFTDMPMPRELPDDVDAKLMLVATPDYKVRGDFDLKDGKVAVGDEPEYTFSGVALYRKRFFDGTVDGRFPLAPMFTTAAKQKRLAGEVYHGVWEDVGTPERLKAVDERRQ